MNDHLLLPIHTDMCELTWNKCNAYNDYYDLFTVQYILVRDRMYCLEMYRLWYGTYHSM